MADRARRHDEDPVDYAVSTGRISAARAAHWRAQIEAGAATAAHLEALWTPNGAPIQAGRPTPVRAAPQWRPEAPVPADSPTYARNPLVDAARQRNPEVFTLASAEGPPPSLFIAGDLPVMTASGIDPQLLLTLPWQARHPAAETPDRAAVQRMFEQYSGPEGAVAAAYEMANHPGNLAYSGRVSSWMSGLRPKEYSLFFAPGTVHVGPDNTVTGTDPNETLFRALYPEG